MLKKAIGALLLLAITLVPMAALGQMLLEGKWWRDPRAAKQLGLSEDQIVALDEAAVEHHRVLIKLKSAVEQEQFELGVLIEKADLDDAAVMKQVRKVEKEKAALSSHFWRMVLDVRKIVGHESFMKIKERADRRAKQKMRRRMEIEADRMGKAPHKPKPGKGGMR